VSGTFDLYNHAYGAHGSDVYRQIRLATWGSDFGQTSWVSTEESDAIPRILNLLPGSQVLEIGFGSGLYAIHLAKVFGCNITGVDINANGIAAAEELARQSGLQSRVTLRQHDVSEQLPFDRDSFDAAFSNDVFCHVPDRLSLLRELYRVLRPGGRLLFSDALVIGGLITNEELAVRSSIGVYVFTIPGVNESLLKEAGFHVDATSDTTSNTATIADRWRDARQTHGARLVEIEGEGNYEGLQRFLSCTSRLARENRLRRYVYQASKPGFGAEYSAQTE
jgi:SAM-dependent methyltransferase